MEMIVIVNYCLDNSVEKYGVGKVELFPFKKVAFVQHINRSKSLEHFFDIHCVR